MSEAGLTTTRRLLRDPAGIASALILAFIVLACLFGPRLLPHAYDAVYPDYVMVPASLTAHPTEAERNAALRDLSARARLDAAFDEGDSILRLSGSTPIDPRVLRLLARSDIFAVSGAPRASSDGNVLRVPVRVVPERFFFGTDANGRDLLARVLVAGRVSLAVGALASAVALGLGVLYGAVAGYVGGRADALMMRFVDIVYALPFIFLVIVLLVFFGRSLWLIFIAVGAVEWLDMARIVRGQTISLKRRDFVVAARALGAGDAAILRRHILPNAAGTIVAYLALLVPRVILAESFLSFLGLGVQEPLTSWGILIADGARHVQGAVHLLVFPAAALGLTVLAANQLGEALLRATGADRP